MLIICYVPKLSKVFNVKFFFEDSNEFARRAVEVALAERERSGIKRNDMIDVFVKLKSEAAANGMSTKEFKEVIAAQMAIFLAGGTETSSTTIANILFEVAKHSHVQDRLRQEILQAFDNENGSISYETLTGLEYLNMIIDETLRMYPVFPFIEREHLNPSNSGKQFSLKPFYDFNIPKGMGVFISTYGLHYDPKYWHEPEKFNPERFSPENKKQLMPMIYLPFGGGPRNCIGWRMGLLQVAACIVHILKNHYVKLCPQTHLKPEFNAKAFVLQTKGGMYLEAIRDDMCKSAAQNTACNK
uniref:Cytochrome P450 n=2 Tax=Stomoxys calcitrans TaxID=35570 RepID=A0A1I8PJU5_STOCA